MYANIACRERTRTRWLTCGVGSSLGCRVIEQLHEQRHGSCQLGVELGAVVRRVTPTVAGALRVQTAWRQRRYQATSHSTSQRLGLFILQRDLRLTKMHIQMSSLLKAELASSHEWIVVSEDDYTFFTLGSSSFKHSSNDFNIISLKKEAMYKISQQTYIHVRGIKNR